MVEIMAVEEVSTRTVTPLVEEMRKKAETTAMLGLLIGIG